MSSRIATCCQAPDELLRRPLSDVVAYLNERCSTDLQKVRAYFRWLCTRCMHGLIDPDPEQDDDDAVLNRLRKLAANFEYNEFYADMCE